MFLSEWCEFPSVPCLVGKKKSDDSSRLDVVEIVEPVLQAEAVLQPATRILLQPIHTETPTHIEPRTIRPMW